MKTLRFKLINRAGLHARPAAIFVQEVKKYRSQIIIKKGEKTADAKNVLQVLSLGADMGDIIEVVVNGPDEDQAVNAIEQLLMKVLPEMDGGAQ